MIYLTTALIAVCIAVLAVVFLMEAQDHHAYVMEFPHERYSALRDIELEIMNARLLAKRAAMYANHPDDRSDGVDSQAVLLHRLRANVVSYIDRYRENLRSDPKITQAELSRLLDMAAAMEAALFVYFDHYVMGIMDAARAGDEMNVISLTRQSVATVSEALMNLDSLLDENRRFMANVNGVFHFQVDIAVMKITILAVIFVIHSIVMALFFFFLLKKPAPEPEQPRLNREKQKPW